MRWSKSKIKEHLRQPSRLSERERTEFEAAEAADRVSNVDQGESQERADLFEDILADWFEQQGVRIRRQPEMVKEQKQDLDGLYEHLTFFFSIMLKSTVNLLRGLMPNISTAPMSISNARRWLNKWLDISKNGGGCSLSTRILSKSIHARLPFTRCQCFGPQPTWTWGIISEFLFRLHQFLLF